jgi:hypothetical protein
MLPLPMGVPLRSTTPLPLFRVSHLPDAWHGVGMIRAARPSLHPSEEIYVPPSHYRICVAGSAPRALSWKMDHLGFSQDVRSSGNTVTVFEGRMRDQAALFGVLNALYSWHQVLLSVEQLDREESKA